MTTAAGKKTSPPTRRVKLRFDKNGDPLFESVKSPECFKVRALVVWPPRDTIPVIFVPGLMGTNLMLKGEDQELAWRPPNGTWEGIKAAKAGENSTPAERQRLFDPENTIVDNQGECRVNDNLYWLTTDEARRRSWGELHAGSYLDILHQLEHCLNDQYMKPDFPQSKDNHLLGAIGLMQYLDGRPGGGKPHHNSSQPDYGRLAREAVAAWHMDAAPKALTKKEIERLDDYYYPVWAFGYNWLRDCEETAMGAPGLTGLVQKIDEVIAYYQKSPYFKCEGKVILVTHSLGGLVARRAAKAVPDKIMGVVHGVCPLAGAPTVYRRFRAGIQTEFSRADIKGQFFADVAGNTAAEMTATLACAPGPLALAPTGEYPKDWLRVTHRRKMFDTPVLVASLPKADPYEEIYKKTTDECWWGMLDPALIDPAGIIRERNDIPLKVSRDAIDMAKKFHDALGLYAHPNTYGFYGVDNDDYRIYGSVTWEFNYNNGLPADIMSRLDLGHSMLGHATVPVGDKPPPDRQPSSYVLRSVAVLLNDKDQAGDGTVPADSGKVLERLQPAPREVFRIAGADHQGIYNNKYAIHATVYSIARIVLEKAGAVQNVRPADRVKAKQECVP
jgi:pimeloyl-ACP methyl ester carboxylesterase